MKRLESIKPYGNRILGTIVGLIIALLFLTIGFWKTILIVLFSVLGYVIGKLRDEDQDFYSILQTLKSLL